MSLAAATRLGPYEILGPLGAGGMGEVYRATDTRLDRTVALKVLPQDFLESEERKRRFEKEARTLASLNHPNIAVLYSFEEIEGRHVLTMELLEGESLREVIVRRTPTARQVLSWTLQAAQGLLAAHAKGIVHRDIKPENLFLTSDGRIKILDFGLAKLSARTPAETEAATASGLSVPGVIVGTVAYMSPEQIEADGLDPRSDIFSLGVVLYELLARDHPFRRPTVPATLAAIVSETPPDPSLRQPGIQPQIGRIVKRCLEKAREERYQSAQELVTALETVLEGGSSAAALRDVEEKSPYPGLLSFKEEDAGRFFGREEEVEALWRKLHDRKLLAVIGPSGAGKTSFVRAGVVAARPEGWAAIVATPGSAPLRNLGQSLAPRLAHDPEALRKLLTFDDPESAFDLLSRWRRSNEEALVVLDQFEELFTLNPPEMQALFASLLGRLAIDADVHVLLSLRDDFLMRCHEHQALSSVFESLTPLGPMTPEGLQRALVEPAAKRGYLFEDDALVDEMVGAVEGARGALPLLAFAVSRLWEKRSIGDKILTRGAYVEIGGVAGALAQHAEATMDRIGSEQQNTVREIFRNLVTAQGTRAVMDREELLSAFTDRSAAEEVLRQLVDARLLTSYEREGKEDEPGRHGVEIVHESLLGSWPRLVRWQAQEEEGALLRDQLKQAARLWQEKGRTADLLWTGTAYQEFRLWRGRYPGALTALEDSFAKAMVAKARRRKRLARVATVAVVLALTAVAIAIGVSRQKAVVAAQRAEASKLLALAQLNLQEDPTEALAFATASLELADTKETRLLALRALQESPPAWEVAAGITQPRIPTFSPDGRNLAVAGHSSEVGVWNENGGPPIRLPGHDTSPRGGNVAAWATEELLVTGLYGTNGRRVHIWSMPAGKKLRTIDFGAPSRWQAGAGQLFAETELPSSAKVYDLRSWRLPEAEAEDLGRADGTKLGATSSAFEPHGRGWLYTVGLTTRFVPLPIGREGGRVLSRHSANATFHDLVLRPDLLGQHDENGENRLLFFPQSGQPVTTVLPKPTGAPPGVWVTTSDRWVIGNPFGDARVRLWETRALPGSRPLELRREGSWWGADTSIDPAARLVVTTTHSMSRLTFWPLPERPPTVVDGYKHITHPFAFSPDGRWLATSWADDRLRLWPLPGCGSNDVIVLNTPPLGVWESLVFDPGGKYLFAVGIDDNAWIVPLDGSPGRKLDEFSKQTLLVGAAVSPTGRHVATAYNYGQGPKTLRVWDVQTGKVRLFDLPVPSPPPGSAPGAPTGYEGSVTSLAFLDDSTLFTAGDGGIRRWNLSAGAHELIRRVAYRHFCSMSLSSDQREILFCDADGKGGPHSVSCAVIDLATGAEHILGVPIGSSPAAPPEYLRAFVATQGPAFALVARDGSVRIGLRSGGEPHRLLGHKGPAQLAAISPDLRWVASAGEDNTLRLWPMPDLSKPPLHSLPHGELLAKLRSLTNLRAVRDSSSSTGWKIELGPFPGWKNLPAWEPYPLATTAGIER